MVHLGKFVPAPASELQELLAAKPSWADQPKAKKGLPAKYPFDTMPVNGTFTVPVGPNQPKWYSFQVYCYRRSSTLGKKFKCHRYPDGTFEVWRQA